MSFSNRFKNELFTVDNLNFNDKALELFIYQADNNLVYKDYLKLLKVKPSKIENISQIPFLPIQFFKKHTIITGDFSYEEVFHSSGTTGENRSNHYVKDLSWYKQVSRKIFSQFYGDINEYIILALLPNYLENKSSSLIYMVNDFIDETKSSFSGFMLEELSRIVGRIEKARIENKKVLLLGVTFALLDLAEKFTLDLSNIIVMETGGMKGKREEMTREKLHEILMKRLNVTEIHSEYGMTELLSQSYSMGGGIFDCPSWVKILTREVNDPFAIHAGLGTGGVNIIDLANVDSCAFIETQDLGRVFPEKGFEIRGRLDNSDIRGCNLLYLN